MATNKFTWVKHLGGDDQPLYRLIRCAAGSTRTIKRGEMCEISGGIAVNLSTDKAMAGTVVICDEEVKAADLAGYYRFIVPRGSVSGDLFEYPLATATASAAGAAMYVSDSQTLTTSGSNVAARVWDHDGFPQKQGHISDGDPLDRGVTIAAASQVRIVFLEGVSYLNTLLGDDAT